MAAALRSARIPRLIPLVRDRAAAERQMHLRPDRVHVERTLTADTAGMARTAARDACAAWEIGDLADTAAAVAEELVANVVQHARTDCRLKLSLDERGLWIETRDRGPGGRPATGAKPGTGHGMHLVDAAAQQWGVTPHEQGKTVWALLDGTRS
jgi:anti-sigma regulatory factor (Ser/Thr protein kinase)